MPPPPKWGHQAMMLSDVWWFQECSRFSVTTCHTCLTSVCLSHTSGISQKQRGLGRLKLAQR